MALRERDIPTIFTGVDVIPRDIATQFGPGTDNLQLLLDYENWTAGDPLPNEYTDNSGITSLTDNNTVGEETASPLVGQKSGLYRRENGEYHTHPDTAALDVNGKDFYCAVWLKILGSEDSSQVFFEQLDRGNNEGWSMIKSGGSDEARVEVGTGSTIVVLTSSTNDIGTDQRFFEFWNEGSDVFGRIDNGTVQSDTADPVHASSDPLVVGAREGATAPTDGLLDQVMLEIAPEGNLFWSNHSSWIYNGGAGRTTNEILTYDP